MTRLKQVLVGRNPKRTLIRAAVLAIVSLVVFGYPARPVRVKGISMEPTLHDGSIHFINRWHYAWSTPQRGDLVAVAMPGGRAFFMKRVLGMPGERIAFVNGQLLIDGAPYAESYLRDAGDWNMAELAVPEGHYFIAGDNRQTPWSGHTLGLIHEDQVSGRLLR